MMYLDILHILEDIFAVAFQSVHADVLAEHERIRAVMDLQILHPDVTTSPEDLVGIVYNDIFDFDIVHLAEHFRCIYHGIGHFQMVGVPEGRPASYREIAVPDSEAVYMPERVVSLEAAVFCFDIAAFLDGRLPFPDDDILQAEVMRREKRPLSAEFLICYDFHNKISCMNFFIPSAAIVPGRHSKSRCKFKANPGNRCISFTEECTGNTCKAG